ncbi:hypothetical protein PHYSODRAFT_301321 [Phytophthora sojae]|uniref:RING-type domain-containing protein n=1 Tax=Phytophthora sojae (strain P6497) TaxID=1094619 RepID=G4ZJ12_PHYSP|nr:hypothetical protein PHYSODRAFT_301321 [Phytophthora sojae]EGZ18817.1 hypothetical protein PHYSODRAFT_301321 [Phytophthora sojae]|eukprot:XP_009527875.1 hypothetical protein PHYSODRAFT_301321 [Phytophthora sojae]
MDTIAPAASDTCGSTVNYGTHYQNYREALCSTRATSSQRTCDNNGYNCEPCLYDFGPIICSATCLSVAEVSQACLASSARSTGSGYRATATTLLGTRHPNGAERSRSSSSISTAWRMHGESGTPHGTAGGVIKIRALLESDDDVEGRDYAIAPPDSVNASPSVDGQDETMESLLDWANFEFEELATNASPVLDVELELSTSTAAVGQECSGNDIVANTVQPRDGVTDCLICICPLRGQDTGVKHDPRCANCRAAVQIDVDEDEVVVVKHVPAPPTCFVCNNAITGIVLEGSQCDHKLDYECLISYNRTYLGLTRHRDLLCPECKFPFPVNLFDSDSEGDDHQPDQAFEYDGSYESEESASDAVERTASSSEEYHPSDFNSELDDSDDDYHSGDD